MVGTLAGVTVFLVLLFFATQLLLNLYATSTVTAAAFDAARVVAGSDGGRGSQQVAEGHARLLMGGMGSDAQFVWNHTDTDGDGMADHVELHVLARSPSRMLADLDLPFQTVDRTVRVRVERLR